MHPIDHRVSSIQKVGSMRKSENKHQKKRQGWWWKISLGLLLFLFSGLAVTILNINSIAHRQINQALEGFLTQGGRLDFVDIQLMEGRIDLGGLTINAPKGYGTDPFLSLNTLSLDIDLTSLFKGKIGVEKLTIKGVTLTLVRDKKGRLSLLKLVPPEKKTSESEPVDDSKEQTALWIPAVRVDAIRFENISVRLFDQMAGDKWSAGLQLDLAVDGLQLKDLERPDILVGKVNLALSRIRVDRSESFRQTPLFTIDKIGIATSGLKVGDFTKQAISLDSFALDLTGAAVSQPPDFDTGKLASLERFSITTGRLDLASLELVVEKVLVQGLTAWVTVHSDGLSNLAQLNKTLFGTADRTGNDKVKPEIETDGSRPENALPGIRFEQIRMEGGSLHYHDEAVTEEALVFPLDNIQLTVTQLRLFNDNAKADPASASMSFELGQPGDLPTAYFGSVAVIGPVSGNVPLTNALVWLTGFKLDTLGSLVSPATRASLGATGFDAGMALALDTDTDRIKLQASVRTDKNIHYDAMKVQGPLDAPTVEMGPIAAGVFGRFSGGVFNFGKSGLNAGVEMTKGGLDVVEGVGSSAVKITKGLFTNLFKTTAGVVTLDRQKVKKGLVGSTKGTVDLTVDSVQGAGHTTGDGIKSSFSDLKGDDALQAWNEGIPARYQTVMQLAKEKIVKMPYPPVTD